ncbi:MAG TPA: hypothetical protein VFF13_03980 [archaeon]|nr:hypothetical protein [archaeon]
MERKPKYTLEHQRAKHVEIQLQIDNIKLWLKLNPTASSEAVNRLKKINRRLLGELHRN